MLSDRPSRLVTDATTPTLVAKKIFLPLLLTWPIQLQCLDDGFGPPCFCTRFSTIAYRYYDSHMWRITECRQFFGNHEVCVGHLRSQTVHIYDNCCHEGEGLVTPGAISIQDRRIKTLLALFCLRCERCRPSPTFLHFVKCSVEGG